MRRSNLVPIPRLFCGGVTGRVTCAFALCGCQNPREQSPVAETCSESVNNINVVALVCLSTIVNNFSSCSSLIATKDDVLSRKTSNWFSDLKYGSNCNSSSEYLSSNGPKVARPLSMSIVTRKLTKVEPPYRAITPGIMVSQFKTICCADNWLAKPIRRHVLRSFAIMGDRVAC